MFKKKQDNNTPKKDNAESSANTKSNGTKRRLFQKHPPDHKKRPLIVSFFVMSFYFCFSIGVILFLGLVLYGFELNREYKLSDNALGGALWELPSRVYARPMDLYQSKDVSQKDLEKELTLIGYSKDRSIHTPATYFVDGNDILIHTQTFAFWDGVETEKRIRISFADNKVAGILDLDSLTPLLLARLEPMHIASIYPSHQQDRILVDLEQVPDILIDGLLAAEDRRFWSHPGVDAKGLTRAVYTAVVNRNASQGASTITQQFVKNHFLSSKRTISRKVKEAVMAIILEMNYEKKDILEGYLNEIYLGQDGARAIHGFGMASEFYFAKPLEGLSVDQIAILIGLVREPGKANPFSNPDYAIYRRNLMLDIMVGQNLLSAEEGELAKSLPLDIVKGELQRKNEYYHSFLTLVYQQLNDAYKKEDLTAGLNIFTTLDPLIQEEAEKSIIDGLADLEKQKGLRKDYLQAASVIINTQTADVLSVVGDRDPARKGYNRAVTAKRQPGSLLKPAVYLSALEYPLRYSLATQLDDSPLTYQSGGTVWQPKNYSKNNKGHVTLKDSLIHSYNIPTARIGLDLGIDDVVSTLERLGARQGIPHYPSIVLGSVTMSPMEVTEIYETLANGGYRMPLRAIRDITDINGNPVERFPISSVKAIEPEPYYLIVTAMQDVVKSGTARRMNSQISPNLHIAGKTGTTDDYRDSWFAGFSGNLLSVVWVGNDDNKKTGLSGSSGALPVWMNIMKDLPQKPLELNIPEGIINKQIDTTTGLLFNSECEGIRQSETLPFIVGSEPVYYSDCYEEITEGEITEFNIDNPSFNENNSSWNGGSSSTNNSSFGRDVTNQPNGGIDINNSRERSRGGFNN